MEWTRTNAYHYRVEISKGPLKIDFKEMSREEVGVYFKGTPSSFLRILTAFSSLFVS